MTTRVNWLLLSVLCSVILAGTTAWIVTNWVLHRHGESHAQDHSEPDFHAWMHKHLDITPEQHAIMEPLEAEFAERRVILRTAIRKSGHEVAESISAADPNDIRLKSALEALNRSQGDLQRLTLDHFFAMKRHLRPAQAKRLLDWTYDSLTREP
jgi:Spy/CpxP family protein refolding chaperone